MTTKEFREREKRVTIPATFFNGETWEPFENYPGFLAYTDKILADLLQVSPMRVGMWRAKNEIPFDMKGAFACYDVNNVITALKAAGYEQETKNITI